MPAPCSIPSTTADSDTQRYCLEDTDLPSFLQLTVSLLAYPPSCLCLKRGNKIGKQTKNAASTGNSMWPWALQELQLSLF